jgi:hypothetical protein
MPQSSEFVENLIHKVNSTGCNNALCGLIDIIELNTFFKKYSIEGKKKRFGFRTSYELELVEVILSKEEIAEIAGHFLEWAGLPKKVSRIQILCGLQYFPGEIGAKVTFSIIQKYGEELTHLGFLKSEILEAFRAICNAFGRNQDFDEVRAVELLTEMNPLPFIERYIDFPNDDDNEIASHAKELLEHFTKILD